MVMEINLCILFPCYRKGNRPRIALRIRTDNKISRFLLLHIPLHLPFKFRFSHCVRGIDTNAVRVVAVNAKIHVAY